MGCCSVGGKSCCKGCGSGPSPRPRQSSAQVPLITLKQLQERQSAMMLMKKKK